MNEVKSVEQLKQPYKNKRLSPLRAIKLHCKIECCVNDMESWKNCTITSCFLYRYRLGKGNRSLKQKHSSKPNNSAKSEPSGDRQEVLV